MARHTSGLTSLLGLTWNVVSRGNFKIESCCQYCALHSQCIIHDESLSEQRAPLLCLLDTAPMWVGPNCKKMEFTFLQMGPADMQTLI